MKRLLYLWPLLLLAACGGNPASAPEGLLKVNAEAEVRVQPDRAALALSVVRRTADLREGREAMKNIMADIETYLREQGTEGKNFKIRQIRIMPLYRDYDSPANAGNTLPQAQYELEQSFTVTLEDPAQYESVLYGLLEHGVNRVEGVEFYSSEIRKYRDEARLAALQAAQEKAALLARAAGIKTGQIKALEEMTSPVYYLSASNAVQNLSSGGTDGELGSGLISVKASVSVSYEIE